MDEQDEKLLKAVEFLEAASKSKAEEFLLSSQSVASSSDAFLMDHFNFDLVTPIPISSTPLRIDASKKDVVIHRLKKNLRLVSKQLQDLLGEEKKKVHYPKRCLKFYNALYQLVNDPSSDSIISWSKSNKSFIILNQDELIRRKILLRFFCSNLTEFVSRLKKYGFKQIKGSSELLEFGDKNFVRGRPELMVEMHKRVSMDRFSRESRKEMKAKAEVNECFQKLRI